MRSIFSELIREERLLVVEEFVLEKPKTKDMAARLAQMGLTDVLIVTAEEDEALSRASRNLHNVAVQNFAEVNPVSLLSFDKVVMTMAAAERIGERLG